MDVKDVARRPKAGGTAPRMTLGTGAISLDVQRARIPAASNTTLPLSPDTSNNRAKRDGVTLSIEFRNTAGWL
jgi:hypothetical protein